MLGISRLSSSLFPPSPRVFSWDVGVRRVRGLASVVGRVPPVKNMSASALGVQGGCLLMPDSAGE